MTSYISKDIENDLKQIDLLSYDKFIRYIVNKDRNTRFNNFFLDLFLKVTKTDNIQCDIPEKIISRIYFSAISLYKYHKHLLEINLNRHDKLVHTIAKETILSLYQNPKNFLTNMNIFYKEFNIWKKLDLEYQMNQCNKSIETYNKIENLTKSSSQSEKIYNKSLGKIKTQIDNYVTMLNKFNV